MEVLLSPLCCYNTEPMSMRGMETARPRCTRPPGAAAANWPRCFWTGARTARRAMPNPAPLRSTTPPRGAGRRWWNYWWRAEILAAAELDMQWHTLPATAPVEDPDVFEKAALEGKH